MRSAAALLALLAAARAAAAQSGAYVAEPVPASELPPLVLPELRSAPRFAFGGELGVGAFGGSCVGCPGHLFGLSLTGHVGVQVAPRLALLAELWSVVHLLGPGEGAAAQTLATAAARLWLTPIAWLQGGLGAGLFSVFGAGPDDDSVGGLAALLAGGGEVRHDPDHAIDLLLRVGAASYVDETGRATLYMVTAGVGWSWY